MFFQCIKIRQVPGDVLKTAASGLGFQHLPRDLANVNAWKTMFDPYNGYWNIIYYVWSPNVPKSLYDATRSLIHTKVIFASI